jgi:hypothetical protein
MLITRVIEFMGSNFTKGVNGIENISSLSILLS